MSKKNIELEHPMAGRSRVSKAEKLVNESNDIFNKLDEQQKAEREQKTKSPSAEKLKSLKELLLLGNLSKTVEIDGFAFTLKSLSHQDNRDIAKRIFLLPDEDKLSESGIIQLAYSLTEINGFSIKEVYDEIFGQPNENLSKVDMSIKILSNLNNHAVGKLLEEFFNLSLESKKMLNLEDDQSAVKK